MFGGRRRTDVAGGKLEDGAQFLVDIVSLRKSFTLLERDPSSWFQSDSSSRTVDDERTLVFAVSTLNLLVCLLLDFALEDSGSGRLVETGSLQDVGCINPIITSTAHNWSRRSADAQI